jgi:hypothetical protein
MCILKSTERVLEEEREVARPLRGSGKAAVPQWQKWQGCFAAVTRVTRVAEEKKWQEWQGEVCRGAAVTRLLRSSGKSDKAAALQWQEWQEDSGKSGKAASQRWQK